MTFGEKLKDLRESRFITQQKLANDLGVSQSSIAAYERNSREPSFNVIENIANYFHVPFSALTPSTERLDDDFAIRIGNAMKENPKIAELFELVVNFTDANMDTMLSVARSISK